MYDIDISMIIDIIGNEYNPFILEDQYLFYVRRNTKTYTTEFNGLTNLSSNFWGLDQSLYFPLCDKPEVDNSFSFEPC